MPISSIRRVDDLDRLVDRLADALDDRRIGPVETHQPAADIDDVDRALAGRAEQPAKRLRQFTQLGEALLQVALADAYFDGLAAYDRRLRETDFRLAQDLSHLIAKLFDLLLADDGGIHLQQQMRAALQIEPEHDVTLRPFRPFLDGGSAKSGSESANMQMNSVVNTIANAFHREM